MATETIAMRERAPALPALQPVLQQGLAFGTFALIVCLIGLAGALSERFIIAGVLNSGQAIVYGLMGLAGWFAARHISRENGNPVSSILMGALAGLSGSLILAIFVALGSVINFRSILVNASPVLYNLLTFENAESLPVGIPLILVAGALTGAIGAALYVMPVMWRNAVLAGMGGVFVIGLLQDLTALVIQTGLGQDARRFFFGRSGLTTVGTVIVFIAPFLYTLGRSMFGERVRSQVAIQSPATQRGLRIFGTVLGLVFLFALPFFVGRFPSEVANNVMLLGIMMALGLNIVVGFAGMLDLGYVGFFAIGAYTVGMLTSPEGIQRLGYAPVDFWVALPIAVLVSVIAGVILGIPVLKMRGDYLAIVTLGFGEIIRILFLSNALKDIVNGAQGLTRIPPINIGTLRFQDPEILYYLILAAVGITWFVSTRLRDSRLGRAWMAIREDEDVAEAMGIDLVATKLLAFGTGAAMAGFGGAIFAAKLQSIVPQTFDLLISINALAVIIIGGLGSIPGVFVGALLLIGVPELLREFAEYRLWAYGVLLVLMMLFRPAGFIPPRIQKRE
jgi:branched-chain amino acid transport system permease protein